MQKHPGRFILFCFYLILSGYTLYATIDSTNLDSILNTISDPAKKVDYIIEFLDNPDNQYLDNAHDLAKRAYDISIQTNYTKGKINSMIKLSYYYFRSSEYAKSMEFAQAAKELSEDLNYKRELAYSLRLLGTIFNEFSDFDKSSQYLFRSLKLFEEIGLKEGIALVKGDIGLDFYYQQDYRKSLEYHNKSLALALELNNLSIIKKQYNNIAAIYGDQFRNDSAIYYLTKAMVINNKLNDPLGVGTNIMNIGYNEMNMGAFEKALLSFQKSLDIFLKLNNRSRIAENHLNFGFCYKELHRFDESIKHFQLALDLGKELRYFRIVYLASQALDEIYTNEKHNVDSAYKYLTLEKLANDSIFVSMKNKQISKLELQYLFEKREFERKQIQQAKNNLMLIIILGLISGVLILILYLSRFRLKSKNAILEKEKIRTELDIKKRELSVNLISLIRKNEMLSEISDELINLEQSAKGLEAKEILEFISKKLRSGTDNKMFEEFSSQFQEVHAGFYESLLRIFPDLTQNELKLCAYLRLNMSTKDISELTGQQFASIDKARYRLRKKLGISNSETNLVSFLSQI
jgi:tetratricopeptide (TPR) repeat protein